MQKEESDYDVNRFLNAVMKMIHLHNLSRMDEFS